MHIYKFRMLTDTNDEFIRDFEILGNQSFLDFHRIIQETVNLGSEELASFHICDQKWVKMKEITLLDMKFDEDEENISDSEFIEERFTMKDSKIKDFIEEPHQRLVYEYDFLDLKTFFIELLGVWKQKEDKPYPICSFSKGKLEIPPAPPVIEEEGDPEALKEQLLEDFNDLLDSTFDYQEDPETEF